MKFNLSMAISMALALAATAALADDPSVAAQLENQVQRIKVLERKLELQDEANTASAATNATVKAGAGGFSLQSANGKNIFKLRGTLNIDGRYFSSFDDTANLTNNVAGTSAYNSADGFLTRKIRPYFEGTLNGIYDFRFQPEFAGGRTIVLDTYIAARFKPWAVITVGKFKNPVGLERLQTEQYNKFIELGFPSSLVPNRDIGLQFSGAVANGVVNYALGIFNGAIDGNGAESNPTPDTDTDNKHEFAVRLFALPFSNSNNFYLRGLGIGIAATSGTKNGNADISTRGTAFSGTTQVVSFATTNTWLPSYRTAAQQTLFSYRGDNADTLTLNEASYAHGQQTRLMPQAYYYYGGLGVIAEYVESKQEVSRHTSATATRSDTVKNKAWQVAATYFFTGEEAAYNSATPRNNFAIGQEGIGAWEIAVRYQKLNIDDSAFAGTGTATDSFANPATAVSAATGYSLAVNWYLNQNVRWTLEYDRTQFQGGAGVAATSTANAIITDRKDESAIVTRFAVGF